MPTVTGITLFSLTSSSFPNCGLNKTYRNNAERTMITIPSTTSALMERTTLAPAMENIIIRPHPMNAAFLGTISLWRYFALAIAAAAVDANLFVPRATCGGKPALSMAGRRSSPPPPTALSTNPAKTPTIISNRNTSVSTKLSGVSGISDLQSDGYVR